MFKAAPAPVAVLEVFVKRFYPRGWSGSLSAILQSRLELLDRLCELNNRSLDDYAAEIRPKLIAEIAQRRNFEEQRDSVRDEQFE
jgi:hypothetical protein